jgi:hypothetical protein
MFVDCYERPINISFGMVVFVLSQRLPIFRVTTTLPNTNDFEPLESIV